LSNADQKQHRELVELRVPDAWPWCVHDEVGLAVELIEPQLGLSSVLLPLKERDFRNRDVEYRRLEGGDPRGQSALVALAHKLCPHARRFRHRDPSCR
jgi:hypothetical protein